MAGLMYRMYGQNNCSCVICTSAIHGGRMPILQEQKSVKSHFQSFFELCKGLIKQKLGLYWSPEQVSGRLCMEDNIRISTETIYRMILKDKTTGGSLYLSLRHQSKKYRKRYGKNDYRGIIPNRIDIADRPSVVDSRSRIGDWEADCVIGKGHKDVFATLAERKSRFYLSLTIKHKTAQETNAEILRLLERIKQFVMTLTFDNGREFSWHNELAKQLECETYFAKP